MPNDEPTPRNGFWKSVFPILIAITSAIFLLYWIDAKPISAMGITDLLVFLGLLALPIVLYGIYKSQFAASEKKRDSMYTMFFTGLGVLICLLLTLGVIGVWVILDSNECGECAAYQAVGLGIVIIWACVFLGYFVWALYFYNINYGFTEGKWKKIELAKNNKFLGQDYSQVDIDDEPMENPYRKETFGLPSGTVRGMIAFSLLFGAIAMLVVSMGMRNELDPASMFWDQYEFFKTAFLMMIAFYFGSRSLQYLHDRNPPSRPGGATDPSTPPTNPTTPGNGGTPAPNGGSPPPNGGSPPPAAAGSAPPPVAQTVSKKKFDPMKQAMPEIIIETRK